MCSSNIILVILVIFSFVDKHFRKWYYNKGDANMKIDFQFSKLKIKTVYIKFLSNMFMILFIPSLILLFVYTGLNAKIKEQTYERNLGLLENSAQKIELLFDNMNQISLYFKDNLNIINFCKVNQRYTGSTIIDMIHAQKDLAAMGFGNNDILNIQIYSSFNDSVIDYNTIGLYIERYYGSSFYLEDLTYQDFRQEYLEQTAPIDYRHALMTTNRRTNDVFVYNNYLAEPNFSSSKNRIIFYVSSSRMLEYFNQIYYQDDGFVCVLEETDKILLSDNQLNYDISQIDNSIFKSDKGYTYLKVNDKKMFVTYYRSNDRNLLYLEAVPASKVLAVTNEFRVFMLCLLLLAGIVGIMLAILIARKLSKPIIEASNILGHQGKNIPFEDIADEITRLVEHNTELKDRMQQQISVMRTESFFKLLQGECCREKEIRDQLDKIGIRQNAEHYVILLLTCNDINLDAKLEEISAQKVFLENVIRKQGYPEIHDIYQIDFERMIIFMASDDLSAKNVRERAESLIKNVIKNISENNVVYSISVGGEMVDNALKLPKAFMHAQRALNVPQNVFGVQKIQWFARAKLYMDMDVHEMTMNDDDCVSLQNQAIIERVKDYINENYSDPQLSLTLVGDEFFVTEVYLSKLFKRATGENFSKYIEGVRMRYAKELIDQNKRIVEVADLVGYNSPQVFRRAWKRYYGGTPSENRDE